jgi:ribosomal protein L7/L12
MGQAKDDKWYSRAERYIELFRTKGHAAATEYLMRFGDKAEKVIESVHEVMEVNREVNVEYRAEMQARIKAIKMEKEILGVGTILPDVPGLETEE